MFGFLGLRRRVVHTVEEFFQGLLLLARLLENYAHPSCLVGIDHDTPNRNRMPSRVEL
jgi:hypothetical protein